MKGTCLLLLTMTCAASMLGTGYAAASNPLPQQTNPESSANTASERPTDAGHAAPADDLRRQPGGTPSSRQRSYRRASKANHVRSYASVANANRPKQFSNSQAHPMAGNPRNLTQPELTKSGMVARVGTTREGLIQNKTVSNALAVHPPSMFPSSSSLNNVRHRSPNSAVISGSANSRSANSQTGNTGAINGTGMSHKP